MFENGKLTITVCGCKHWLNDQNQHHRLDGPAFDNSNCKWYNLQEETLQSYFLNGIELSKEDHTKEVEQIRREALNEIEDMLINCFTWIIVHKRHEIDSMLSELNPLFSKWVLMGNRPLNPVVFKNIMDELHGGEKTND